MKKRPLFFIILAVVFAAAFLAALRSGSVNIGFREIFYYLSGAGGQNDNSVIITGIRLPRIILALIVGGMLGVSGAILQAVLKNPLTDPYITGVSSGAALGATIAIITGITGLVIPAMGGAVLTIFIVYYLSFSYGRMNITSILLIGVMTGSLFSSVIMLLSAVFSGDLVKVIFWLMGDLSGAGGVYTAAAGGIAAAALAGSLYFSGDLNILAAGEEEALTLGVSTEFIKIFYFVTAGVLTGAAVALSGVIGFVGLVVPHICRYFIGQDMRFVIPASFLAGAVFLLCADTAARTVLLPGEVPVGIITGLIGAPVFIFLLVKRGG